MVECFEFVGNNFIFIFFIRGNIIGVLVINVFLLVKVIFFLVAIVVMVGNNFV